MRGEGMKTIETTIFVGPTPKGRPRFAIVRGRARAYTPAKTRLSEAEIHVAIRDEVMRHGKFEAGIPLRLDVTFWLRKPASKPKKITMPTCKPDVDNFLKTVCDSLNGYVWHDDSQLVSINAKKRYCLNGDCPRIELRIREEIE